MNEHPTNDHRTNGAEGLLTIGELAERTGVAAATLRSWERRHGFPVPARLAGGHRRYDAQQVALVAEVARLRRSGLPVPAAVASATGSAARPGRSFYAALRSADPGLRAHTLDKPVLSAVTSAIEDECLAQARRPVLIGAFQRARFFRQSQPRWEELARTSEQSVVFADFDTPADPAAHLTEVPLAADSPARREWVLVCDAPGFPACVAGWEVPSPAGSPDHERRFETVWTLDPGAVRAATRVGIALLQESDPEGADRLAASLPAVGAGASPELRRATALFARIVDYAQDAAERHGLAS